MSRRKQRLDDKEPSAESEHGGWEGGLSQVRCLRPVSLNRKIVLQNFVSLPQYLTISVLKLVACRSSVAAVLVESLTFSAGDDLFSARRYTAVQQ